MIRCSDAVDDMWRYLEQELADRDRAQIEEHLAFCRRCCGELEFARELRRFLSAAARPLLPSEVEDRLEGFLLDLEGDVATDEGHRHEP